MIYTIFKAYRPITLLKTPNKILELIMAKKIIYLAEEHSLLPVTQMGARRGRSTEFALELFTEQIHSVGSTEKQNGYAAKHGRSGCFQYDVSSAATPQFTPKKYYDGSLTGWIFFYKIEPQPRLLVFAALTMIVFILQCRSTRCLRKTGVKNECVRVRR